MGERRMGSKDMRALRRRFRKGYTVRADSGHFTVVAPDGTPVRCEDGSPFKLANTPAVDHHYARRIQSRLRHAGVID